MRCSNTKVRHHKTNTFSVVCNLYCLFITAKNIFLSWFLYNDGACSFLGFNLGNRIEWKKIYQKKHECFMAHFLPFLSTPFTDELTLFFLVCFDVNRCEVYRVGVKIRKSTSTCKFAGCFLCVYQHKTWMMLFLQCVSFNIRASVKGNNVKS